MKQKILDAIKLKFPTAKLSAKRLDALAATIEAKSGADETLIDTSLDALNEIYPLADIAKDDHVRATLEGQLKAKITKVAEPASTQDNETPGEDVPAWAKALTERFSAFEQQQVTGTLKQKATGLLKDVPASYWGQRSLPATEAELEAWIETVKTDYGVFRQDLINQGLAFISTAPGGGNEKQNMEKIDPSIKAHYENKAAQTVKQN